MAATYATDHDENVAQCLERVLNMSSGGASDVLRQMRLPVRYGGLGLRCSRRASPYAYWASWADSLPILLARFPRLAGFFMQHLLQLAAGESVLPPGSALRDLSDAACQLYSTRFASLPTWQALFAGQLPPSQDNLAADPGERSRGWQFVAADAVERSERYDLLATARPRDRARIRSCAGTGAGRWPKIGRAHV